MVGYEGFSNKDDGLRSLEMELSYLGGICAASLMKKSIPLQTSSGTSTTGSSQTATSSKDGYETESKEDMEKSLTFSKKCQKVKNWLSRFF